MNRDQALKDINEREPDFLTVARKRVAGHVTYICPNCGQGSKNGFGIQRYRSSSGGQRFKCFGCEGNFSVADLFFAHNFISNPTKEDFDRLYSYFGETVDEQPYRASSSKKQPPKKSVPQPVPTASSPSPAEIPEQPEEDLTEKFRQWHQNISRTDYPERRGLSDEIVERFNLGYEPSYPLSPTGAVRGPMLIIPTGPGSYQARNAALADGDKNYRFRKHGKAKLFNLKAFDAGEPVFIVEGEIDAMSIETLGFNSVGLGSVSGKSLLIDYLSRHKPKVPIILALDNDNAGKKAAEELSEELNKIGVGHLVVGEDLYQGKIIGPDGNSVPAKDANDCLLNYPEQFRNALKTLRDRALEVAETTAQIKENIDNAEKEKVFSSFASCKISSFLEEIEASKTRPAISTGFPILDKCLTGLKGHGLYPGLYIIGALSSLGKTALVGQIADNIAEGRINADETEGDGQDVLIFSLEMSTFELMSRSISRLTALGSYEQTRNENGIENKFRYASTAKEVIDGRRHQYLSEDQKQILFSSVYGYEFIGRHIRIIEGINGDVDTEKIRKEVAKHILYTKAKPVVVVDYLQTLMPTKERVTDKQKIDEAVLRLRQIATEFQVPVIAISSLNRSSYSQSISFSAFKESGNIEYSADVLIGMQPYQETAGEEQVVAAMKAPKREIELIMLKNRNGQVGRKVLFNYYTAFNLFVEQEELD
ncbi:MAG: toprim domain-containing protein [Burkholderiales bacterium]|nr:toprim domain-containing protein [Burkholderiales bacterium]